VQTILPWWYFLSCGSFIEQARPQDVFSNRNGISSLGGTVIVSSPYLGSATWVVFPQSLRTSRGSDQLWGRGFQLLASIHLLLFFLMHEVRIWIVWITYYPFQGFGFFTPVKT
jgi:hypothetical protein